MKLLLALVAGIAGYCYYRGAGLRDRKPHEALHRWEDEGGNVPSVATPQPAQPYVPTGDQGVRH